MKKYLTSLALATAIAIPASAHDENTPQKAPPSEVMILYDIATAPDADRIYDDIKTLADFGTRHTLSETQSDTRGIGAARRWIKTEFEEISAQCDGCLEVFYVSDFVEGERRIPNRTEVVNVIAIQRGSLDPNRMVMMSGDIDSRVTDPLNGTSDSPGANDNASGMAGVIESARILSQYKFPGTIVYAGLSGEEQGLFGGKIVAAHALEEGWEIKGVLNNDMISNISGIDGVIDNSVVRVFSEGTRANETEAEARTRRFTGGEVDSPSRNLARYVKAQGDQYMVNLDIMMIYRLDRFSRGGHHRPFNVVGIPGIRIMETHEHYDRQHQDLRNRTYLEGKLKPGITVSDSEMAKLTGMQRCPGESYLAWNGQTKVLTTAGLDRPVKTTCNLWGAAPGIRTNIGMLALEEAFDITERTIKFGDTLDGVDKHYAAKLTALNAITMAGMAGAPPFPENVEASGAVTASATLKWERPSGKRAGNLMGYRVHWRATTAPEWTHSRYVGNVGEWTFENLVIDNYYFGVSAVAHDGSETPVVFPGAAGRF